VPSLPVPRPSDQLPLTAPGPLLDLVRAVAADRSRWEPAVRFDASSRYWQRLLQTAHVDLWLLTWLPGQDTELHDHGAAAAAVTVVAGAVQEVRADLHGALTTTRLEVGDAVWVPPGAVHDVRHAGTGPAVSLHAYSPRLRRMTYYERAPQGLRVTRTVLSDEPELEVAS
jgi:quercetin dioxygenase-like cupin family protein